MRTEAAPFFVVASLADDVSHIWAKDRGVYLRLVPCRNVVTSKASQTATTLPLTSMQSLLLRRTPALTRRGVLTDIGHFTRFYSCRSILQRAAWASRLQNRHVSPSTSIPQRIHAQPSSRTYTTSQKTDISYADPHRPDLYYHLMYAPTPASADQPVFALSFLEVPPPDLDSVTVIGWLPAVTYTTDTPGTPEEQIRGHEPTLDDFVPNGMSPRCVFPKFESVDILLDYSEIC